jgi:hypothetical protein
LRSFAITRVPAPLALGFRTYQILLILAISDVRVHFPAGPYIYLAISPRLTSNFTTAQVGRTNLGGARRSLPGAQC